jgi:hypothetical protein
MKQANFVEKRERCELASWIATGLKGIYAERGAKEERKYVVDIQIGILAKRLESNSA